VAFDIYRNRMHWVLGRHKGMGIGVVFGVEMVSVLEGYSCYCSGNMYKAVILRILLTRSSDVAQNLPMC
jgi:hypothetical protein